MENEKSVVQEVRERNYNPFAANVVDRSYTRPQVGVTPDALAQPIPEPTYQPQQLGGTNPYDNLSGDGGFSGASNGGGAKAPNGGKPVNPAMGDLPPHERRQAAEHLADMAITGYEMLHVFGNKALQVSQTKIRKLVAKDLIDLSIQIPFGTGTITAQQFIQQYNEEVSDALSVSNKFKKDVRPPLVRVLEKRGIGATDEQQLLTIVLMDLVVKGGVIYQALGTQREMIKVIQERTQFERDNGYGATPTNPEPSRPTTPKQPNPKPPKPQFTGEDNTDAPDFNFRSNEAVMNSSVQQMKVPNTGKARSMAQAAKEKIWEANARKADTGYAQAMQERKMSGGKRGRPKKDNINTEKIAEAIILKENKSEEEDPLSNSID